MSPTDPIYVVTYDRAAFEDWCARKGHDPQSRAVRHVRDVAVLARLRHPVRILFVHGWRARKDATAVYSRALVIGRKWSP